MVKYVIAALAGIAAGLLIALRAPMETTLEPDKGAPAAVPAADSRDTIDALIKGLRSPDAKARSIFHKHLVEETGMFFGFNPSAFPEEREAVVRRWVEWWAANRNSTKERWLIDSLSLEGYGGKQMALERLSEMSSKAAVPAVTALLDDSKPELRLQAARTLGNLNAETAVDRLSLALETDGDMGVRRIAARALGQIGTKEALYALKKTAGQDDILTRIEAASALMLRSPDDALPVLHSLLIRSDEHTRQFALSRLGDLRRPESVPHLARLLPKRGPSVKKVREVLKKIVGRDLGEEPGPWHEWYEQNRKQQKSNPM